MTEAKTETAPETTKDVAVEKTEAVRTSIVDTVFDMGMAWANYGLKVGQQALETSAKSLEQTAKILANVSAELGKKA